MLFEERSARAFSLLRWPVSFSHVFKKAGQECITCPAGSSVLAQYEEDIEEQTSLALVC
jgi:hypothetical protein